MKSAAVALVVGVAIYLLARDGLVIHAYGSANFTAPDVIAYQLPDALWQYAFCMVVCVIWGDRRALLVPLGIGLVAEASVGTFDPRDVIALLAGALAASFQVTSWARGSAASCSSRVRAGAASSLPAP
ncbi:MAG: hypothetical protein M4D80_32140 [Myxococcota bacterium]|nr:hypothetical protein [Deltaproteobacteria bacterium]MDQ3339835.1 hypothetical protein [Myxococcota bacterium]